MYQTKYENYKIYRDDSIKEDFVTTKKDLGGIKPRSFDTDLVYPNEKIIHSNIDAHIHSEYSLDGYNTVETIVKRAKENSVDFISITDHNSVMAFHDLMRSEKRKDSEIIYNYDGVDILCGSEVTCYMYLDDIHKIKFHLLCYGFDRGKNSSIMDLISSKYDDYKRSQFAILYYLAKKDDVYKTSTSEIRSYVRDYADKHEFTGDMTKGFATDFYKWKGISEDKILNDLKDFNEQFKRKDKLKLDIIDVINATHQDGGLCSLAHPTISIEKFRRSKGVVCDQFQLCRAVTEKLLLSGLDGIELANKYTSDNLRYNKYFSDQFLVSCGSDTHYFDERMYKDIGKYRIDVGPANVQDVMYDLQKAHKNGELTEHQKQTNNIGLQDTSLSLTYEKRHKPSNFYGYNSRPSSGPSPSF